MSSTSCSLDPQVTARRKKIVKCFTLNIDLAITEWCDCKQFSLCYAMLGEPVVKIGIVLCLGGSLITIESGYTNRSIITSPGLSTLDL